MEENTRPRAKAGRRWGIAIAATIAILYLLPAAGHPPATNPNELVRLELALAMATWSSVDLAGPARIYGLSEDIARRNGRVLADKAPGLSMATVPVVWLADPLLPSVPGFNLPSYWPLRHVATALVSLGTVVLCFFLAASIPQLRAAGVVPLATVAALTTPLWTYGTVFFGHAPAAGLVAAAWIALLRPFADVEAGNTRAAFVGGLAAGLAIATEYPTALLVGVIFATLIARRTPRRRLALAFAGLAIGLVPALVYHQLAFGSPWLTGYAFKADPGFQEIHGTGLAGIGLPTLESLWGVLLSPSRGIFFFSPVLLLAPIGLFLIKRRHGWREAAPLTTAVVLYLAFGAGFVDWQAGWCSAARHLVPVIPLLIIPTLLALTEMSRHRWGVVLAAALAALSATRGLLTIVITPFFPPELVHPLRDLVVPSLTDGVAAVTLPGAILGIPPLTVWALAAGGTAILMIWAVSRLVRGPTVGIAIVVVLVMAGQVGWLAARSARQTPEREMIRAQVLAGLGHTETARRIVNDLETGSVDSQPRR